MAQITINQKKGQFGNNPYGNVTALIYTLQADNKGLIVNSGYDKTLQANDIVRVGCIPEGFIPFGYRCFVDSEFNAGAFDVGFGYSDGVDDKDYPAKETGYMTLPTLTTKNSESSGNLLAKQFSKDAYLAFKTTTPPTKGDKAGVLTVVLIGTLVGHS